MMSNPEVKPVIAIDLLRGWAIILMIITHGFRLYTNHYPLPPSADMGFSLLNFFALIEPFTSSLFLCLVGISLGLSNERAPTGWLRKQLKKAGQLYLLGLGLFLLEYGYQPRDLWFSPSILSTIAAALLIHSLWLTYLPRWSLSGLGLGLLWLTYHFEGMGISGINGGPGGILPLISFTTVGIILSQLLQIRQPHPRLLWLGVPIIIGGLAWLLPGPWINHYQSSYYIYGTESNLLTWISSRGQSSLIRSFSFWNHSLIGSIRLWLPLSLTLGLVLSQTKIQTHRLSPYLVVLGRNALNCYILHLLLISILDLSGVWPATSGTTWALIGLITIATYVGTRRLPKWL